MNTVRINRRRWARGKRQPITFMWSAKQRKGCCLGHAVKQVCKLKWDDLHRVPMPCYLEVGNYVYDIVNSQFDLHSKIVTDKLFNIARINDDTKISDTERESTLIRLFDIELGIKLEFYN